MDTRHAGAAEKGLSPLVQGRNWVLDQVLRYREVGVLIALLAVIVVFGAMQPLFLSLQTFGDVLTVAAELGVVAVGVTLLMISREFDLSVGSNFALTGLLVAMLVASFGWSEWAAFAVALVAAAAIGLLNGLITLSTGIPSFITTLGTMMFWRGIALFLTGGWPVSIWGESPLLWTLGGGRVLRVLHTSGVWWLAVASVGWLVLAKTRYGNWVMATGGKEEAARALGVPSRRVKLVNFTLTGLLAGLAGCLQLGRMASMSPVWGDKLELEAIAAAVIGGTSLLGGVGTVAGTALGAVTMASIRTGLVMVGAPAYWYQSFIGAVLVAAVVVNVKLEGAAKWRR